VLSLFFGFARKKYDLMLRKIGRTTTYFLYSCDRSANAVAVRGSMYVPIAPLLSLPRVVRESNVAVLIRSLFKSMWSSMVVELSETKSQRKQIDLVMACSIPCG
jgi:hypothetical protein